MKTHAISAPENGGPPNAQQTQTRADRVSARACEWRAARFALLSNENGFGSLIGVSHGSAGIATSVATNRRQCVFLAGDVDHG
jgi:hypothetical protein